MSNLVKTILLAHTGTVGSTKTYTFNNNSLNYFNTRINQSFEYVLIDNIGTGRVRISFIKGLTLSSPINGTKTLRSGDNIYIEDSISYVAIYFIEDSQVELVLISD